MNATLVPIAAEGRMPALVAAAGERASMRFLEFFAAKSETRTRAEPMLGLRMNFWLGAQAPVC